MNSLFLYTNIQITHVDGTFSEQNTKEKWDSTVQVFMKQYSQMQCSIHCAILTERLKNINSEIHFRSVVFDKIDEFTEQATGIFWYNHLGKTCTIY